MRSAGTLALLLMICENRLLEEGCYASLKGHRSLIRQFGEKSKPRKGCEERRMPDYQDNWSLQQLAAALGPRTREILVAHGVQFELDLRPVSVQDVHWPAVQERIASWPSNIKPSNEGDVEMPRAEDEKSDASQVVSERDWNPDAGGRGQGSAPMDGEAGDDEADVTVEVSPAERATREQHGAEEATDPEQDSAAPLSCSLGTCGRIALGVWCQRGGQRSDSVGIFTVGSSPALRFHWDLNAVLVKIPLDSERCPAPTEKRPRERWQTQASQQAKPLRSHCLIKQNPSSSSEPAFSELPKGTLAATCPLELATAVLARSCPRVLSLATCDKCLSRCPQTAAGQCLPHCPYLERSCTNFCPYTLGRSQAGSWFDHLPEMNELLYRSGTGDGMRLGTLPVSCIMVIQISGFGVTMAVSLIVQVRQSDF